MDIETLSDDVLLEIFDLYQAEDEDTNPWHDPGSEWRGRRSYDAWYTLAHVCQRWRYVVFESPRRLNLRLHCTRRRVREMVGVWPALPIVIWDTENFRSDDDNIIAALHHRDRVCEIKLGYLTRFKSKKLVPLMQESFPALTKLQIQSPLGDELVLPDSFLGGSAPHLRFLCLSSISFPAFPNLLLSASNLVYLYLDGTPSGYISPKMVAALSALNKLEVMYIHFNYAVSDSDLEDLAPPPLTRSILPALNRLELRGDGKYLDGFVAWIDVPSINHLQIEFTNRPIFAGDFFHLPQFIGRVEKFHSFDYANFDLSTHAVDVHLSPQIWVDGSPRQALNLKFLCDFDGPLPSLADLVEVCNSLLPLSNIESFSLFAPDLSLDLRSGFNAEDPRWLEILRQFPAAKNLYLGSMVFVPGVAFGLKQVIEEGMTDVLPAIQKLSLFKSLSAGPVREAIEQFVTARGLSAFETPGSAGWRISARDTNEG